MTCLDPRTTNLDLRTLIEPENNQFGLQENLIEPDNNQFGLEENLIEPENNQFGSGNGNLSGDNGFDDYQRSGNERHEAMLPQQPDEAQIRSETEDRDQNEALTKDEGNANESL